MGSERGVRDGSNHTQHTSALGGNGHVLTISQSGRGYRAGQGPGGPEALPPTAAHGPQPQPQGGAGEDGPEARGSSGPRAGDRPADTGASAAGAPARTPLPPRPPSSGVPARPGQVTGSKCAGRSQTASKWRGRPEAGGVYSVFTVGAGRWAGVGFESLGSPEARTDPVIPAEPDAGPLVWLASLPLLLLSFPLFK